jgi:MFS family permease
VMLLVSALLAPSIGRRIDRDGARALMVPGTLVGAFALLVIACAHGPIVFWVGWAIFGVAVALMMNNAAVPALVDIAGNDARRAVSAFTIITGLTGAVFLPLTAWLEARYGWRITLLIFSFLFLSVCLPIHLAVLPEGRRQRIPAGRDDLASANAWDGHLPVGARRTGFWLVALWMALQGFIVWGFNIQVVDILQGAGLTHSDAIAVWMLSGPAQALVRVGDVLTGGRTGVMRLALMSASAMPIGFAVLWFAGLSLPIAALLAVASGAGQGLHAVARNLVPLRLFGMKTFGTTMGQLSLPLNICNAAAPLIYSALIGRVSAWSALTITAAAACLSLAAVIALSRLAREAESKK